MALTIDDHERLEKRLSASLAAAQKDPQKHERRVRRWLWVGEQLCALASVLRLVVKDKPSAPVRSAEQTNAAQNTGATTLVDTAAQASSTSRPVWKRNFLFDNGQVLKRDEVPALFAVLDDLCVRAGIKTTPAVFLVEDSNAYVNLGPYHSLKYVHGRQISGEGKDDLAPGAKSGCRLGIGRQLLQEVSVDELRAILAHELGHVVGRQTQFMCYYRDLRQRLASIGATESSASPPAKGGCEKHGLIILLARSGTSRFSRFLWVRMFPVHRNSEWEADCHAAHLTGREMVGRALVRTAIARTKRNTDLPTLIDKLDKKGFGTDNVPLDERILAMCLSETTKVGDTHPCLRERLSALNVTPQVPPPVDVSAMSLIKQKESRPDRPWLRRAIAFIRKKCYRVWH